MCHAEIRDQLLAFDLCDHCLGRQFGLIGHGLENYERGWILRQTDDAVEEVLSPERVPEELRPGGSCRICQGLFDRIDEFAETAIDCTEDLEFNTFVVGTRLPEALIEREEQLQEKAGVQDAERLKRELNRLIGKSFERQYDGEISVDQDEPDVMVIVDLGTEDVEVQNSPLYVFGRYNKYSREIPQTVWHCRSCRGEGCKRCDGTGKMYQASVQELIQPPFLSASGAEEAVFHGAGREDIDAICTGKRPFVLELKQPRRRSLDFRALEQDVNESTEDVEVFDVQPVKSQTVADIKQLRADKTYRALVDLSSEIHEEDLMKLSGLEGKIEQDTPSRVTHRRADRTRTRTVHRIDAEKRGPSKIDVTVKAEAGTYIKELISGDGERTTPNLSDVLGTSARCDRLDVIEVHENVSVTPPGTE